MSGAASPIDFNDCVSWHELTNILPRQNTTQLQLLQDIQTSIENLATRVGNLEQRDEEPVDGDEEDDDASNADHGRDGGRDHHRPHRHRQGMGGNHGRADPYSKVKFTIPSFDGSYDGDAYLDWEMIVEQKFNTHMVPENHRVRLATCEFTGYAILWWNELDNSGLEPDTWERLKRAMRGRFLHTTFKRDLKKKLQHLNQGNNSVSDYYQEMQITMLRCGVQECDEDKMIRFHSGLRREIQDIVDYKDYNTTNRLLHLALLAEKEL